LTRSDWQRIAEERVLDAEALLIAQRWSAAYYLAGYAVECGLKACVVVYVGSNADIVFREKEYSRQCWTHDIEKLVALAGLKLQRDADASLNPTLDTYWQIVRGWTETARYEAANQLTAETLYQAVTNAKHGVLPWIKNHW
jgi:HEPN domain-containing protein